MQERAISLWAWIRLHRRLSLGLALVLVVAGVGTAFIISQLPPPPGQACGQINYPPFGERDPAVQAASMQVISCFWHAYQHCQSATISLSYHGIDTGGEATLTVEHKGLGCDVYDKSYSFANTASAHRTFRCASMTQQGENLHLSNCGGGQPPFDIQPISLYFGACGAVGPLMNATPPAEAEQCFVDASSLCAPAQLSYATPGDGTLHIQQFEIRDHCMIVYIHDQYQATCDGIALRADGLHFFHCGNDGEVVVPATVPTPTSTPTP
jgi:hypothetical protein